jgi:sugar lactone lactonase YvrE
MHRWLSWAGTMTLVAGLAAGCGGAPGAGVGSGDGGAPGDDGVSEGGYSGPGGTVATLGDQPVALAVIGDTVYVALFIQGIVTVPTAGGAVTPTVPAIPGYAPAGVYFQNPFAFDRTSLYFSESSGGYTSGPIAFAPLGGGTPTVLTSSKGFTAGITQDADGVYWVDQDEGTINRIPIAGGAATVVASGLKTPGGLALQGGNLYFTDAAGDLLTVPASGGAVTTLLAGPGLPPNTEVADYSPPIATDASNVYFAVCPFEAAGAPTLYRVPLGNGGPPTALASSCPTGLAVDGDSVYWTAGTTVNAVPIAGGTTRVVAAGTQAISAGPALDAANVYWGITPEVGTCAMCPPPPSGQVNAVMRAPKQ